MNGVASEMVVAGASVAGGALAAAALGNPIGAAGGAVFGATSFVVYRPINFVCTKVFNTDSQAASLVSKIVSAVAGFFATAGVAMGVANLMGYSITFGSALALSAVSMGITIGIAIAALLILGGLAYAAGSQQGHFSFQS